MPQGLCFSGAHRKRILVTGASGAIGSELVRYLKAQPDVDIVALNSASEKRIDIKNKAQVKGLLQKQPFDFIYHLAALNPFQSNRGADYFDTNVQGTENILESVLELKRQGKKAPVVFLASTALVYSPEKIKITLKKTSTPIEENQLTQTLESVSQKLCTISSPMGSVSDSLLNFLKLSKHDIYYNDSKLLAEMTAGFYAREGVPIKVGRLVNCYGRQSKQLINQFVRASKEGKLLTLKGKDSEARDYLFYDGASNDDDVLRMIQSVTEKGKPGEAYHIASEGRFVRSPQSIANTVQVYSSHPRILNITRRLPIKVASFFISLFKYFTDLYNHLIDTVKPSLDKNLSNRLVDNNQASNNHIKPDYRVVLSNQKIQSLGIKPPRTSPEEGLRILLTNHS